MALQHPSYIMQLLSSHVAITMVTLWCSLIITSLPNQYMIQLNQQTCSLPSSLP